MGIRNGRKQLFPLIIYLIEQKPNIPLFFLLKNLEIIFLFISFGIHHQDAKQNQIITL